MRRLWWVVGVLMLCAGPAWALEGQQWQCNVESPNETPEGVITCRLGHPLDLSWTASVAGGTFSDPTIRNPIYTPPENLTGADMTITLTVTGTCSEDPAVHGSDGAPVVVFSEEHSITIHATAEPVVVAMGESSQLGVSWQWSAEQGRFDDPSSATPRFWPSLPGRVPITVSGIADLPYPVSGQAELTVVYLNADGTAFWDVPPDSWAYDDILYLYQRGVVNGYPDGSYQPTMPVTRDQMAVYLARALRLDPVG